MKIKGKQISRWCIKEKQSKMQKTAEKQKKGNKKKE